MILTNFQFCCFVNYLIMILKKFSSKQLYTTSLQKSSPSKLRSFVEDALQSVERHKSFNLTRLECINF